MKSLFRKWWSDQSATAAMEMVLVFPILLTLLMGVDELGTGIIINQKCIAASQMVADLIARNKSVTTDQLADYVQAGKLAMDPYSTDTMGFDIVSIQYDANNNPQQLWRYTVNMIANNDGLDKTQGLGVSGDGILAVSVTYSYVPPVSSFVISRIPMEEITFEHGRETSIITEQ